MRGSDFDELLKIQRNIASRLREETKVNSKIEFINFLRTFTRKRLLTEKILIEAQNHGFEEEESLKLIDELISEELIIIPDEGYLELRF